MKEIGREKMLLLLGERRILRERKEKADAFAFLRERKCFCFFGTKKREYPRSSSSISFYEGVKRKKQRDALLFWNEKSSWEVFRPPNCFFAGERNQKRDI